MTVQALLPIPSAKSVCETSSKNAVIFPVSCLLNLSPIAGTWFVWSEQVHLLVLPSSLHKPLGQCGHFGGESFGRLCPWMGWLHVLQCAIFLFFFVWCQANWAGWCCCRRRWSDSCQWFYEILNTSVYVSIRYLLNVNIFIVLVFIVIIVVILTSHWIKNSLSCCVWQFSYLPFQECSTDFANVAPLQTVNVERMPASIKPDPGFNWISVKATWHVTDSVRYWRPFSMKSQW